MLKLLLAILPRSFREEFAGEMTLDFNDQRRRMSGAGVIALWASTLSTIVALSVRLRADQLRLDLRDAARSLLRHRTFAATSIATLALAFGPATTVFTLVDRVVLDPIPLVKMEGLYYVWTAKPQLDRHNFPWSELNFVDTRARQTGFSALAAYTGTSSTLGGADSPQQVMGAMVTADMFNVLGVAPAQGRMFEPADFAVGATPVIVLGYDFARARYGERPPVGETLRVDARDTQVIGVLPRGLRFPAAQPEFWIPIVVDPSRSARGQNYLNVIGRLASGRSEADALAQLNQIAVDLEREHPDQNSGMRIEVAPAAAQLTRSARRIATVVGLAAAAIFLLACTNIASLLVVRTAARQSELAVRAALGANRSRLVRQLLTENVMMAGIAAIAAVGVSMGLLRIMAIAKLAPPHQLERSTIGGMSMLFLAVLVTITSVILGWAVARRATRATAIATGQRTQSATHEMVRLRQVLVSVEVGAAAVLLVAAGLLLQSAAKLVAVDPGFRRDIIAFQISMPFARYGPPADRMRFIEGVVAQLKQLPGVEAAASAAFAPMTDMRATRRFAIDGEPLPPPGEEPLAIDLPASPDYARTVGLRIIQGRWIDERDTATAPPVVVISESFARRRFPNGAIGKRLRYYANRPNMPEPPRPEVVGIVSDVRQFGMAEAETDQMYVPHAQRPFGFTGFFLRTSGDPRQVMNALPAAVHAVDPERPIEQLTTFGELVSDSTSDRRGLSALLIVAAIVALLISTIGVYGVTAATTAARKRELAIRAAVGADRRRLMSLVLRQGMIAAVVGVAAGIGGGIAASGLLRAVLFEVKPRDPATFAIAAIALLAVCGVASYLPARRAVAAGLSEALRAE